jgi:hypothetical protein
MNILDFVKMLGFKPGDEVKVEALSLQELIKDKLAAEKSVVSLSDKLENCYNKNEELMEQIMHKDAIIRKLTKALEEIEGVAKQTTTIRNQNEMLREKLNLSSILLERKTEREKIDSYLKVDLKA